MLTLTFTLDLLALGSLHAEDQRCTVSVGFGADSSSHFPFRHTDRHTADRQTDRQTDKVTNIANHDTRALDTADLSSNH